MPSFAAGALVFATSGAVLILEILAGRLLAPYVGVTLQTYTGIIGTVLAGIAVGSWLGGRLADRVDPRALLGPMVALGGVLALFAVPAVTFFGAALAGGGAGPFTVLVLSVTGFFAPAAVLSAVTPTVVKLQLADLDETGQVVGRLSALGTAGAILGTFTAGFLLVAAWPSRPIVLALGGLLVAGGLALWWWLARGRERFPSALVLLALAGVGLTLLMPGRCHFESAYFCARVEAAENRADGRVLLLDTLRHSYVDLSDPSHLEFDYTQVFADVITAVAPGGEPVDALHIGGGGFTMPRWLRAEHPGSHSLVLELDPMLVRIAENELGLERGPNLRVVTGDARLGVARQPADRWDIVIGDAFGGLAVPWHLTTVEFIDDVRATLRPDGLYMINIIDYPPLRFARAKAATLASAFEHAALVAPPRRVRGAEGGNFVLVASDAPLDTEAIAEAIADRGGDEEVVTGAAYADFTGGAQILVDDHAPVDQLLTPYPQ